MQGRYAVNQSPLYRLTSKKKLAGALGVSVNALFSLAQGQSNYHVFSLDDGRVVEHPVGALERIHRRVLSLLQRIDVPDYLHSGVKGRSYITNARAHLGWFQTAKLDIRRFYPSTTRAAIFRFFRDDLLCASDVSGLAAELLTFRGHLPTGSPMSQLLAYHVHRSLFDAIHRLAARHGAWMTCYVDDVTVTGECANGRLLHEMGKLVNQYGLAWHKARTYAAGDIKVITGVVVDNTDMRLPNRRHLKAHTLLARFQDSAQSGEQLDARLLEQLVGQLNAATELDGRFLTARRELRTLLSKEQRAAR